MEVLEQDCSVEDCCKKGIKELGGLCALHFVDLGQTDQDALRSALCINENITPVIRPHVVHPVIVKSWGSGFLAGAFFGALVELVYLLYKGVL